MSQACNYTKWVVIGLLVLLAGVVVMQCMKKSSTAKEHFQFDASQYVEGVSARPGLVSNPYGRFDPFGLAGNSLLGDIGSSNLGAAGPQTVNAEYPIEIVEGFAMPQAQVEFSTMGGAHQLPNGALSSSQAQDMLQQTMNGGKPDYFENTLPTADIQFSSMNPMDPNTFMYDRTVFAPLKRQYGNQVDFIRGDIDVKQEFRGWFDLPSATQKDRVVGYFDRYIDIQQETALKDATFTRTTPVQQLYEASINPAGFEQTRVAYANV
jgi:hypothetical protein